MKPLTQLDITSKQAELKHLRAQISKELTAQRKYFWAKIANALPPKAVIKTIVVFHMSHCVKGDAFYYDECFPNFPVSITDDNNKILDERMAFSMFALLEREVAG